MKTVLMDGIKLRNKFITLLKKEVIDLKKNNILPHLCVVQIGENPASNIYVNNKKRMAKKLGIDFTWKKFDKNITFEKLKLEVNKLNNKKDITGIIIQFPLPISYSKSLTANLVNHKKDADGISDYNQTIIKNNKNEYAPVTCTPKGIMKILKEYDIKIENKKVVVLGRSRIVGAPMATLLRNAGAAVKVINRETSQADINDFIKEAKLIISATGAKDMVKPEMVSPGVDIIDVGIIRENNQIRGDLKYQDFIGIARHITPVPGGVGPMTVIMLMHNVIELAKKWGINA